MAVPRAAAVNARLAPYRIAPEQIGAAARSVGKTARSAYQLRDKDGAESFAVACA